MIPKWKEYHSHRYCPWKVRGTSLGLGNLHQEEEPPEHLALKSSGAFVLKSQKAVRNLGCALSESWQRAIVWKAPRAYMKVIHWLVLGFFLEKQGIWNFFLNLNVGGYHFSLFFTLLSSSWSDASRHYFWPSSSTLITLLTPPWHFPEDSSRLELLQMGSCPVTPSGQPQSAPAHGIVYAKSSLGLTASHTEGLPCTIVSL